MTEEELIEHLQTLQTRINEKLYGAESLTINGVNFKGHNFEVALNQAGTLWPGYIGKDIVLTVISDNVPVADIGFEICERLNIFTWGRKENVEMLVNGVHKHGKWQ